MTRSMLFTPIVMLTAVLSLPAQWAEVGDAGELPGTAQIPGGLGALATITGAVTANNADMYLIQINSPTTFSATTVGGPAVDTQLFLFDEQGRGVSHNDDSTGTLSTITGANVLVGGRYYLAVTTYNYDPRSFGQFIWNNSPFNTERAPDGPGRGGVVTNWSGSGGAGAYTITLTGCDFPDRQVLLPDNHHLGKSATQNHASGSPNWWGGVSTTGRRFMVLYEGSHFTGSGGVFGPIGIMHLRFRGEDTEHNVGGQTFSNVTVSVYKTTLTTTTYNTTTFATNIAPVLPETTTLLGTLAIPTLTVQRSLGTAPNNYCINLDFPAPLPPFDPTGGPGTEANLLIDVAYTAAAAATDPQASTMVAIQDTAGTLAQIRGRGTYATSATAATGTASSLPPVILVEFGTGSTGRWTLPPARSERYGAACGGAPSTFYQLFPHNERFDLSTPGQADGLSGLVMTPDVYPNPNYYTVTGGAAPIDLVNGLGPAPVTQGDDTTVAFALPTGTVFYYPGGPAAGTGTVRPSSNGYLVVDPASTETASDFSPTVAEFLGSSLATPARFAPLWHDFSPNKNTTAPFGDPLSGLHAVNNVAGNETLVTWYRVGRFNSVAQVFQEEYTMQVSLNWVTGVVQFRYGNMDRLEGDTFSGQTLGITGFSRGRIAAGPPVVASVDPQSRDLSVERPFATRVEGAIGNIGFSAAATPNAGGPIYMGRAFTGQTLTWNATGIPAGALCGVTLIDIAATRPGFNAPGIVAPGCILSTSSGATLWEITFLPPASVTGVVPLFIPPGNVGFELYSQYVLLDGLFGGPDLITAASNAVKQTVGLN